MIGHSDEGRAWGPGQSSLHVLDTLHCCVVEVGHEAAACMGQDVHDGSLQGLQSWGWGGGSVDVCVPMRVDLCLQRV
jgi:hypothetical protein